MMHGWSGEDIELLIFRKTGAGHGNGMYVLSVWVGVGVFNELHCIAASGFDPCMYLIGQVN